ncbi:uroporphyrinogen-III synthase [Hoeflea sp. J2-29]|uniref:Uroporphyrinogen-III synthase n=1 Tax=Hoeflea ulvae TaxID=2983764 RepID=A0ABT3YA38_9HYPH|nr:uroporphyrinogen-III synthase [Hoeflea ulvae]
MSRAAGACGRPGHGGGRAQGGLWRYPRRPGHGRGACPLHHPREDRPQADSQATESRSRTPLVYLAGVPRTTTLEEVFAAAREALVVLECYKMDEISYTTDFLKSDILSPAPDLVLLYSANAARRFCGLFKGNELGERLESARFVCLSQAIATELPDPWQRRSIIAQRPDEDSLLASLASLG